MYYFHRSSDLTRDRTGKAIFASEYAANLYAGYGELSTGVTDKLTWINGLRLEEDHTLYSDSDGNRAKPSELLWGGRMALEYQTSDSQMLYGLISRGYKVGGFNSNGKVPAAQRNFDSETLWNYELGAKHNLLDDTLHTQVAVFFQQRDNAQIKASRIIGPGDFADYTANADSAYSYGLEAQAQWQASQAVLLRASLGLLQTELKEPGAKFDGRDAAHAPEYQFAFGVDFDHGNGWFSGLDVEGKEAFYFSDSHNARSDSYALLNARFGYQLNSWTVTLWGKNLTDEEYAVRGFEFGNDPRNSYATDEYVQLGEPRMFGITTKYSF